MNDPVPDVRYPPSVLDSLDAPFFDEDAQEMVLSTGRRFYCFNGVLGLSADTEPSRFQYGHDGGKNVSDWSHAERQEIAAYMVRLWAHWAGLTAFTSCPTCESLPCCCSRSLP